MKHATAAIDVGGLFQVLDTRLVARQLAALPGVHGAQVNYASGSATLSFDPEQTSLASIEARVRECGYHCGGEILPAHVCATAPAAPKDAAVRPAGTGPALTPTEAERIFDRFYRGDQALEHIRPVRARACHRREHSRTARNGRGRCEPARTRHLVRLRAADRRGLATFRLCLTRCSRRPRHFREVQGRIYGAGAVALVQMRRILLRLQDRLVDRDPRRPCPNPAVLQEEPGD